METSTTNQPDSAPSSVALVRTRRRLTQDERQQLSIDLLNGVNAADSARKNLLRNLQDWMNLYDMRLQNEQAVEPWPDASNVFIPIVPAQLDTALAYITARTLVPRFYIMSGFTDQAQANAYIVERYYNAEFVRQRGPSTWYDRHVTWLHLGLRDGTAIMRAVWKREKTKRNIVEFVPRVVNGVPVIDTTQDPPRPVYDRNFRQIEVVEYDDVELTPIALKDFFVLPDESYSIQDAVAVGYTMWLYELDLAKMEKARKEAGVGEFYPDAIERALSYVQSGVTSDVASDPLGHEDKTAGGQIAIGINQGSQTSSFFKNRGPIKVHEIHSRQYDMDGDGVPEENIFYFHWQSQTMLGWEPDDSLTGERPFFAFSPNPRPDRFYGYSMVERLSVLQGEINKMYNDRNNAIDLRIDPPLNVPSGMELRDNQQGWAPGAQWEGEGQVSAINIGDIPLASFQQEALTKGYVTDVTGQNQPVMGAQSSGRRTATENKIQAAATGTRNDLVAIRYRIACRALINHVHRLKLQYLSDDPVVQNGAQTLVLPRQVLAMDYRLDVAGATDPVDAASRLTQDIGLYQLLTQNPLVAGNMQHLYAVTRMVLEAAGRADISTLIGTEQDIEKLVQAQQQQAQQAAASGQQPGQQQHPAHKPQGKQHPAPQMPA
jgi:hypothetical protein